MDQKFSSIIIIHTIYMKYNSNQVNNWLVSEKSKRQTERVRASLDEKGAQCQKISRVTLKTVRHSKMFTNIIISDGHKLAKHSNYSKYTCIIYQIKQLPQAVWFLEVFSITTLLVYTHIISLFSYCKEILHETPKNERFYPS